VEYYSQFLLAVCSYILCSRTPGIHWTFLPVPQDSRLALTRRCCPSVSVVVCPLHCLAFLKRLSSLLRACRSLTLYASWHFFMVSLMFHYLHIQCRGQQTLSQPCGPVPSICYIACSCACILIEPTKSIQLIFLPI
jgi:hypothetical protein